MITICNNIDAIVVVNKPVEINKTKINSTKPIECNLNLKPLPQIKPKSKILFKAN